MGMGTGIGMGTGYRHCMGMGMGTGMVIGMGMGTGIVWSWAWAPALAWARASGPPPFRQILATPMLAPLGSVARLAPLAFPGSTVLGSRNLALWKESISDQR